MDHFQPTYTRDAMPRRPRGGQKEVGLGMSVEILWLGELHVAHGAGQSSPGVTKSLGNTSQVWGLGFRVWVWPACPPATEGPTERPAPRGGHKTHK